ncbi:MAG: nucleobase:cation symporter-1, NCS1 family [Azoarcus sp.]|uniref:Cytosine/uracil/thiamine/allantoin permease n=1 Tax=Aromatoleum tolulyticum TaxID=34027 RepID=A0A1N6XMN7_9RHOO|nr:cytosine permease [Aromatoleum tolulyticum]MCK9986321.1 nucleobase:cation symporter-1, NCS1 family [Azoarcus sp.]SIR03593.1 Cytosine/uracil/thiamine/allantoin permease [Aromatoleum tolulyticum]
MEYGTARIPHDKREYGFVDTVFTWFGSGVNTGSWVFGGMAAALGMSFVWWYSAVYLPLMMIPWAMVAWIGWKHGASTVTSTIPALGVKGARFMGIGEFLGLIGWPSINTFIAAISLTHVFHAMFDWPAYGSPGSTWPLVAGILVTALLQGIIVCIGHSAIKYLEWLAVVLLLVLGIWETKVVLEHWDYDKIANFTLPAAQHSPAFYIDLAFGFCWGWAQICDFSRFSKSSASATVGSWLGVNLGQGWFMLVGAIGVIGVVLETGVFDPNNADPSSTIASLGLGMVAFLVVFFATVSTNVTVLYGAGMGLVGAARTSNPRKFLYFIAILQLVMCFLPLVFDSFIHYFEFFLGIVGGVFIPLWTLVVLDYFVVRRARVRDEDLFAGEDRLGRTLSALGDWNICGWVAMIAGLAVFYLLHYGFKEIAIVTTASLPAIAVTAVAYLLLVAVKGVPAQSRVMKRA